MGGGTLDASWGWLAMGFRLLGTRKPKGGFVFAAPSSLHRRRTVNGGTSSGQPLFAGNVGLSRHPLSVASRVLVSSQAQLVLQSRSLHLDPRRVHFYRRLLGLPPRPSRHPVRAGTF